jgi:uncharacterized protein YdaU (DUF1376 family)
MNRAPAFQFYAKDWLSSKKIVTMTLEEEGAYIHLLAHCWDSPDCTLPNDDSELAQLSRMGERWLNGGSTTLRKCFIPHPRKSGRLTNLRLLEEFRKYTRWIQKSREGGIRSGEIRRKQVKGGSTVVEPKANSSSSSSLNSYRERKGSRIASELNGHGSSFELFWAAYPKKEGKGACRRWWKDHKPDDVLLGLMLAKIEQAKLTQKWNEQGGKFIPMPSTWLNQERWEDEYTASLHRKEGLVL